MPIADRHRTLYHARAAAGMCTRCGLAKAVPNVRECEPCRQRRNKRPGDVLAGGVPMSQALTPEQCADARHFLRWLWMAARRVPAGQRVNVKMFLQAYREIYGRPSSADNVDSGADREDFQPWHA